MFNSVHQPRHRKPNRRRASCPATVPPMFPNSDPAETAELAAMFNQHLSVESMLKLGKYDQDFTLMALTLMDATWTASQP